jgi:hypothetical protein
MASVSNPNAAVRAGNGLGPITRICTIVNTGQTQAELDEAIKNLQNGVTISNVFYPGATVAGVTALADTVYVALQGGVAPEGTASSYATDTTVTVVTTFDQA